MEKITLTLEEREPKKPNRLRREGKIPATVYGRGVASRSVQVSAKEFSRLPAAAYSHIVELNGGELGKFGALIRNVHRKATTHEVLNIEFYRVQEDRKITVQVPIKLVGESAAVQKGGQLLEVHQEVSIECLPKDIPDFIEVDISRIEEIDEGIHYADLPVSPAVKILNPLDDVLVRVVAPRVATVEEEKPAEEAIPAPAEGPPEPERRAAAPAS